MHTQTHAYAHLLCLCACPRSCRYVHAINMMPFTPITEELLRPHFVAEEYPVLVS
jgi:hypothetical protein